MSSKRAVRRQQCGHKRAFATEAEAQATLPALYRRNARTGSSYRLNVYRCPYCGAFHVGHERAEVYRTRRAQFP